MTNAQTMKPERLFKSDLAQLAWDNGASHSAITFENIYAVQRAFGRVKRWMGLK